MAVRSVCAPLEHAVYLFIIIIIIIIRSSDGDASGSGGKNSGSSSYAGIMINVPLLSPT